MIVELGRRGNAWTDFRTLARLLLGDVTQSDLLAGLAGVHPQLFLLSRSGSAIKLTPEGVHLLASLKSTAPAPVRAGSEAATAVREYGRQLRPLRLAVQRIGPSRLVLERYLHNVTLEISDDDVRVIDDTPVTLVSQSGRRNDGHVVGISRDEAIFYIAFFEQVLPGTDLPATLEVNRSKPLIAMAERLEAIQEETVLHFQSMVSPGSGVALSRNDSDEIAQQLCLLGQPWTRLLWGPPGAGKTRCVAAFTRRILMAAPGNRVLLVAPSNVAVDAALTELLGALEQKSETRDFLSQHLVARFGYSKDERILARHELFGPPELEKLSKGIASAFKELRQRIDGGESAEALAQLKATILQMQQRRRQKMATFLSSTRLVATTIASALAAESPLIAAGPWQTVIVDEASMITGASALLLASIATERFLVAGDPRQLGPIFEWRRNVTPEIVERWCAKDPYDVAGVSAGEGEARTIHANDSRLARLLSQRRCHPDIWSLVADLYPKVTSAVDMSRLDYIAQFPPKPGSAAVVLDLSNGRSLKTALSAGLAADAVAGEYESACRNIGGSWENPPTAMLAIDVAREIRAHDRDARIAIIAPYRAQIRLLRRWLEEETLADARLKGIDVGTVHAFQGGEADAVIFDTVDGPPRPRPGILLRQDTGTRLVNVAVTRARGKLVILAHLAWLRRAAGDAGLLGKILFGADRCLVAPLPPPKPYAPTGAYGHPESPIEQLLVDELNRRRDILPPFVLQHRIYDENGRIVSRADIAFVDLRLAIYCDGAMYHLERNQWQRDQRQRRELTRLGWQFLVFTGSDLNRDASGAAEEVARVLRTL